jgi:NAD(P)H-nitrite reductase large subunit
MKQPSGSKRPKKSARPKLVVLGNGMAAGRVLDELFARAPDRYDVTIFGAEPRVNYDRIMLSPVLAGEKRFDDIIVHSDDWYSKHNVDLRKARPSSLSIRWRGPCERNPVASNATTH